jgi:hypothetical protein
VEAPKFPHGVSGSCPSRDGRVRKAPSAGGYWTQSLDAFDAIQLFTSVPKSVSCVSPVSLLFIAARAKTAIGIRTCFISTVIEFRRGDRSSFLTVDDGDCPEMKVGGRK